ncbi:Crp/Fnr family transcriptional regulator [Listeria grandensis]|uniref:Crp/Fnr family transcriptional regulator n=1 Tax=Listeria grandensis TaxID=1494963 RepID=UPI00164EACEC|nr:Crp/Fnr family transcriptional regulator [Listeria grandensis]MBC6316285.1 Crp/Fnr family transcriptional regulator [Listeria grandensis]
MMNQQTKEMHFLYNSETVTQEFSEHKFYYFLQKDLFSPIEGTIKKFKKHEFLITEKEMVDEIYFIQSGCVMAMKNYSRVIDFYTEEDIVGFDCLLLTDLAAHSFKAISDEVLIMKYKKSEIIEKVLNAQEGYLYHYVHMQNQIKRLLEKEELLRQPSEKRIGFALLQIIKGCGARKRYSELVTFPKHINKGILAKYTNLNPNTVTNVLQKLQEESIIQVIQRTMHVNVLKLQSKLS